jgi:hypothetical protein
MADYWEGAGYSVEQGMRLFENEGFASKMLTAYVHMLRFTLKIKRILRTLKVPGEFAI